MKNDLQIGHPYLSGNVAWYVHGRWEYTDKRRHYQKILNNNQMVYKLGGKSTVTMGDESFDAYSGIIFISPKGYYDRHYFDTETIGDSIDIFFDSDIELPKSVMIFDARSNPKLRELFLEFYKTWERQKPGAYYKCTSIFYEILYEISILGSEYIPISRMEQIGPAINYIHEHCYDTNFTCDILAEKCNMSYTYFKRIFNISYKMPPIKYVTMLRMSRAADLLNSGEYTCSKVAEMVGYQSNYYFTRVFKKYYNMTPSEYKSR